MNSKNIIDSIITYINEWRSEMEFIASEFTDKDYGPIENLPPFDREEILIVLVSIEGLLSNGWSKTLIIENLRCMKEACPFWKEEFALRWLYEVSDLSDPNWYISFSKHKATLLKAKEKQIMLQSKSPNFN